MLRTRLHDDRAIASPRLLAELDLGAVRTNVATLRQRLSRGCRLLAVVKADAYGHGAVAVAHAVLRAGASGVAVADVAEGERLRRAGIDASILIVGPSLPADAERIVHARLVPTVADQQLAAALAAAARAPFAVEVEIDTGMRRHGVPLADAVAFVRALRVHRGLTVRSVFTHFQGLDAAALPALRAQWRDFAALVGALRAAGHDVGAHACNTLGTLLLPEAHADAVRIGGGLYGFDQGLPGVALQPALTLRTQVAALRVVAAGEAVGYGGAHVCAQPTLLALLPCGYADGLSRAHWNGGQVLVRGHRARIVGHVSMNQMVVDVGGLDVAVGDPVVLLGAMGGDRLRAEDRAAPGCSPYEVTALLRPDLPRVVRGGA